MSAVTATPEERIVRTGFRNMLKRLWRKTKSTAKSIWTWVARSSFGTVRAALRAIGYVGRGATWVGVTALTGLNWTTATVVVLVLAVLTSIAVLATALGGGVIWVLSKVIYFSHFWGYGFFKWVSLGRPETFKDFRTAMILVDSADLADVSGENLIDDATAAFAEGYTEAKAEPKRPAEPTHEAQVHDISTDEQVAARDSKVDDILDAYTGSLDFPWDTFAQDAVLLDAFRALSNTEHENQGHYVGRYKALAEYLTDPTSWDPEDPRALSLTLHQFRSQQSKIPAKQIKAGFKAQNDLLTGHLASV